MDSPLDSRQFAHLGSFFFPGFRMSLMNYNEADVDLDPTIHIYHALLG
jgi:hypothetical protein